MRKTWVWRNGEFYEKHLAPPHPREITRNSNVIGDCTDFVSPIDGKHYSSRAGRRDHNARHGVVDVGNDPQVLREKPKYRAQGVAADIKRAMGE